MSSSTLAPIDRRTFLAGLGLSVRTAPLAAGAQQAGKVWRIGDLSPRPGIETPEEAFRQVMRAPNPLHTPRLALGLTIPQSLLVRADRIIQ